MANRECSFSPAYSPTLMAFCPEKSFLASARWDLPLLCYLALKEEERAVGSAGLSVEQWLQALKPLASSSCWYNEDAVEPTSKKHSEEKWGYVENTNNRIWHILNLNMHLWLSSGTFF